MEKKLTSYTSHIESFIHSKWVFLWLAILVGISYVHSLSNAFVSDDFGMSNAIAQWNLSYIFSRLTFLRDLIYVAIYKLAAAAPFAFRLSNILFHLGNTLLIFTIARRLLSQKVAFISASLFAVHPILVESVTWIAGGVYPQYSFFFLASFLCYISSAGTGNRTVILRASELPANESRSSRQARTIGFDIGFPNNKRYVLSVFFFLATALTLDRAVVVFLLFPLYEWCYGNMRKNAVRLLPYLTIVVFFCANILLSGAIGNRLAFITEHEGITQTIDNPFIYLPVALSSYIELLFWPQKLTLYHTELTYTAAAFTIRLLLTILALGGSMYLLFHKRKLFFWAMVFLVPLIPFLTPFHISWLIAERYAYLSSVGVIVIFSYFYVEIMNKYNKYIFFWVLFLFILIALSVRTFYRTLDWKDEDTLWKATAVYSPSSVQNWVNLGVTLSQKGDYSYAQSAFIKAIKLNPGFADIYYNMGVMDESQGDFDHALKYYEKAVYLRPDYHKALERLRMLSP